VVRLPDSAGAIRASVEENKGKLKPTDRSEGCDGSINGLGLGPALYANVGRREWRTIRNCHYQVACGTLLSLARTDALG
jgi:hypothetical protein